MKNKNDLKIEIDNSPCLVLSVEQLDIIQEESFNKGYEEGYNKALQERSKKLKERLDK